jgi:hypothetical protein
MRFWFAFFDFQTGSRNARGLCLKLNSVTQLYDCIQRSACFGIPGLQDSFVLSDKELGAGHSRSDKPRHNLQTSRPLQAEAEN